MVSRALTLAFIGLNAIAARTDEPKKDATKPVAERIAAIENDHRKYEKKFYADLSTFRKDDQKVRELNNEYQKFTGKQADELKALIKAHGEEAAAFDGILVLVSELNYSLDNDLITILKKNHAASPKMGTLCFAVRSHSTEPWAGNLLEETAAKHPQEAVRGQALYALGVYHRYRAEPYHQKLPEAEEAKRLAEAAKCFTVVTKTYASFKSPDGKATLGDLAASQLVRIENLPNLKVGKVAPDIVGEDIAGNKFSLRDYRGKVVLLDFWGHW